MTKWLAAILLLIGMVAGIVGAWILPLDVARHYFAESGPIEIASAGLWFLLAAVAALLSLRRDLGSLVFALLAALAGGRELDIQMRFTTESMINLRYWLHDTVPVQEKVVTAIVVVAVLSVLFIGMKRQLPGLIQALKDGAGGAWGLATIVAGAPVLMMIDRVGRFYTGFTGATMDPAIQIFFLGAEEVGELMLPMIGFVVIGQALEREAMVARGALATPPPDGRSAS